MRICSTAGPIGAFRASACGACRSPFFTARHATSRPRSPEIVDHVADIFEQETADAWYNRTESELLPDGYKCAKCNSADFRKETDILDVWFDSGSSCVAVLETRGETLRFPADVYLEGGDQFRGWFNSSLMCGMAAHDTAPYKQIITHGWVVDGEGKQMHKSTGNAISPNEVINKSGAEIMRLWAAAVDYTEDMRCSEEILSRIVDAYRKFRNTLRYALGNLDGFDPGDGNGRGRRAAGGRPLGAGVARRSGGQSAERLRELRFSGRVPDALQFLHGDAFGAVFRHHQGPPVYLCAQERGAALGADRALPDHR